MSNQMLPAPAGPEPRPTSDSNAADQERGSRRQRTKRRAKPQIPTAEECLAALSKLAQFTVMGIINTTTANATRSIYSTILQHLRKEAGTNRPGVDGHGLIELLRKHPDLASALEPLLSDEQIEILLAEAKEPADGTP